MHNTIRYGSLKLGLAMMLGGLAAQAAQLDAGGGISGTAHDFALLGSGQSQPACIACHVPHETGVHESLWNPKLLLPAYSLYDATANAKATRAGHAGAYSKLCLSCHDGTLAILNYSGARGNNLLTPAPRGAANTATSLAARDHPIGIGYDSNLASSDGSLADPQSGSVSMITSQTGRNSTRSGSIGMMMLAEGKVECTSCHDVHNRYTAGASNKGLVKVGLAGSALCLVCHQK